jgi:hypothetical protein
MTGPILDPFILGFAVGGCLFGTLGYALGWVYGYNRALRKVDGWIGEIHGDVPTPPYGIASDDVDQTWGR